MKPRLLLVDDDAAFVAACRAGLAEAFEVEQAADPRTAMERLARGPFQVVLISVEIAGNQGYGLCAALRKQEASRNLRVALISAKAAASEFDRHRTLRGRADAYFHKPIEAAALGKGLADMLQRPSAAPPPGVPFWKRWFQ